MSMAEIENEESVKQWEQCSVLLNDFYSSYSLPWPCGVCKWIDGESGTGFRGWSVYSILIGTYAAEESGRIAIGKVRIPKKNRANRNGSDVDNLEVLTEDQGRDSVDSIAQPMSLERTVELGDSVLETLQMPQSLNKIAVISREDVLFFDWKKCARNTETGVAEVKLRGSEKMGHSLSWSTLVEGFLLCASENCTIGLWDINRPEENGVLMANVNFIHDRKINAVSWHCLHETLFGSVGDDNNLLIWDTRFNSRYKPVLAALAHGERTLCLSFNHFSEYIVATGSADKIAWSPHEQAVIASRGTGSTVALWDLDRINRQQTPEEASEGPPELLVKLYFHYALCLSVVASQFVQGGHKNRVYDFSWNPNIPWFICSTDAESLHVWHVVT
ncbi:Probable histone binding protein Caf1 [Trichuris trichiura]|uniref:Probable histone binding protein Caf1 n=1 Tax=Trichuris trichiura TaxID=36087 RepID=A0A077ZGT1_TRITR|nr:Probable histone binding protein Caf1 [Trichuris trichiura]